MKLEKKNQERKPKEEGKELLVLSGPAQPTFLVFCACDFSTFEACAAAFLAMGFLSTLFSKKKITISMSLRH